MEQLELDVVNSLIKLLETELEREATEEEKLKVVGNWENFKKSLEDNR